jgi:putative GTP pyrophosphokinase
VSWINSESVMDDIAATISSKLSDVGIMFRLFSRAKSPESLSKKLDSDPAYGKGKKLQDLIGVRVVLYFNDDIDNVRNIISSSFEERTNDVSIDANRLDEFRATRYNIVYSLDQKHTNSLNLKDESARIDNTFELQIRTIFSEGWHEVEHDLRYKCQSDWHGFDNQSRRLNGVYATLETSEWTMIKIFEEIAYSHYKNRQWSAMFRQKFRLRFIDENLDENLLAIFEDKELVKRFFRLDRSKLINDMSRKGFYYPMKLQNLIYFANIHKIKDERVAALIPAMMVEEMSD